MSIFYFILKATWLTFS